MVVRYVEGTKRTSRINGEDRDSLVSMPLTGVVNKLLMAIAEQEQGQEQGEREV